MAGDGTGLAWPLRGDVVEASTVGVEHRLLASKLLPTLHRNIDISRRDFNRVAARYSGQKASGGALALKSEPGRPATLGSSAAAGVRLIVWCRDCRHQVEPDPAEQAQRYGAEMTFPIGGNG